MSAVLEDACARMTRYLRRRGLLEEQTGEPDAGDPDDGSEVSGLAALASTAVSGTSPPAGPVWRRGALPALQSSPDFERHLSVGRGGFTLHAATRAGAQDERGRETLKTVNSV